jgi:hypothetical protein
MPAAIIMARDPYSFPSSGDPFPSHLPMPRHPIRFWRIITEFWRGSVNDLGWRSLGSHVVNH